MHPRYLPFVFFHRLPGRADDRQRIGIRRGDIFPGFAGEIDSIFSNDSHQIISDKIDDSKIIFQNPE